MIIENTLDDADLREAVCDLLIKRGKSPLPETFKVTVNRGYEGNQFDHQEPSATVTIQTKD